MLVTSKNLQQFVTHLTNSLFSNLFFFHLRINRDIPLERKLSTRLGTDEKGRVCVPRFFFFFLAFCGCGESFSGSRTLFMGPTILFFQQNFY